MLQTALDLLEKGIDVHVLADGVSSANGDEVGLAIKVRTGRFPRARSNRSLLRLDPRIAYARLGGADHHVRVDSVSNHACVTASGGFAAENQSADPSKIPTRQAMPTIQVSRL